MDGAAGGDEAAEVLPRGAVIHTTKGDITLKLFPDECPKTVENFAMHARNGYYEGIIFHRVIKGFMLQTGDPLGAPCAPPPPSRCSRQTGHVLVPGSYPASLVALVWGSFMQLRVSVLLSSDVYDGIQQKDRGGHFCELVHAVQHTDIFSSSFGQNAALTLEQGHAPACKHGTGLFHSTK